MTTGIQWTDETWNPVVGCNQVSAGCDNCYAKTLHDKRHRAFLAGKNVAPQYAFPFELVQLKPERLSDPLGWRAPRRVFVNSVSDLFHKDVPDEYIDQVFAVMALTTRHTFQILTKRAGRMRSYINDPATRLNVEGRTVRLVGERYAPEPEGHWPLTREELSAATGIKETTLCARLSELRPMWVQRLDRAKRANSGLRVDAYTLTPAGQRRARGAA